MWESVERLIGLCAGTVEINSFTNVQERFISGVPFADTPWQRGYQSGEATFIAGFKYDFQFHRVISSNGFKV
jgi:hypothetical protein